ncbi:MAG: PD40 domain-containing protein [Marinilabiliaceae bacterium]|nr:PD40 domain-containing protein [Marinilabiliaceae bacterium]
MIRKSTLVLFVALLPLQFIASQSSDRQMNREFSQAVGLAEDKAYDEAIDLFKHMLKTDPEDVDVLYNLGHCYLNTSNGPDTAIVYFEKAYGLLAEEEHITNFGVDIQLSIGKSHQLMLQPKQAIPIYERLIEQLPPEDEDLILETRREIEICENAIELMNSPVVLKVHNLGENINTKYDDHSPLISADETLLLYTSRRSSSYSEKMPDGQYAERIYSSSIKNKDWTKSKSLKELFRKPGHEAGVCLSADGQELYIYRNDIDGPNIYVSLYDGSTWAEPVKLPNPINTKFAETHASVSPDKSVLYFTSDRPGGFGGLDIYRSRLLPNGEWGKPQNLGSDINTQYDEETPIIHPDGRTLYFSSEGHNSMGQYDIFYSHSLADSTWSVPQNMGYPINTPDDDFFFVPTTTQNLAYYASSKYEDNMGGSDIYLIEYEEPEINRLAVFKGTVNSTDDAPIENVRVHVTKADDNSAAGVYRPHPGTGKYVLILEAEGQYKIRYAGEGFEEAQAEVMVTGEMAYKKRNDTNKLDDVTLIALAVPEKTTEDGTQLADQSTATKGQTLDVSDGIPFYTVQILALKKPVKSYSVFKDLEQDAITVYKCRDGFYRYSYGTFKGFKASIKGKDKVLNTGLWQDSFIRDIKQYRDLVSEEEKK